MKLEEVLSHLRAGGKVKLGITLYDLNRLSNDLLTEELIEREDFEIVNKPYKAEHVAEKINNYDYFIDGDKDTHFNEILPKSGKKYKVTIEEIIE